MRPASLKTATGVTLIGETRGREPALPQLAFAEQRFARERFRRRVLQPPRSRRRRDDDHAHRRVEQALRLEPRPRSGAVAQRGVEAIALQVDQLLRRIDLQREMRMALAPAADARQQPAVRERRQHRHAQRVRRAGRRRGGRLHALVKLRQRRSRASQQRFAGGVQHDAAALPLEQLEAELRLRGRGSAG